MKLPYHLPFKTQLYQHKWETGKFNSRFDHRRFDLVLFENFAMRRRHSPQMMASWQHDNNGRLKRADYSSSHKIKYIKEEGRPLRLKLDFEPFRYT